MVALAYSGIALVEVIIELGVVDFVVVFTSDVTAAVFRELFGQDIRYDYKGRVEQRNQRAFIFY